MSDEQGKLREAFNRGAYWAAMRVQYGEGTQDVFRDRHGEAQRHYPDPPKERALRIVADSTYTGTDGLHWRYDPATNQLQYIFGQIMQQWRNASDAAWTPCIERVRQWADLMANPYEEEA